MTTTKDNIKEWFRIENLEPIAMYWYPATVDDAIVEIDKDWRQFNELEQYVLDVATAIREKVKEAGADGNKQVLICRTIDSGETVCIGWFDSLIKVGPSAHNRDGADSHPVDFAIN